MIKKILLPLVLMQFTAVAFAETHISLSSGTTVDSSTYLLNVNIKKTFKRKFSLGKQWVLTPFWETAAGTWQLVDGGRGNEHGMVFLRLRCLLQASISSTSRFFLEAGTGPMYISDRTLVSDLDLGSHLQFDSHAGIGVFLGRDRRVYLSYNFHHVSNASIGDVNPGVDFHDLQIGWRY